MVIIGAKGFAKELLQVLFQNGETEGLVFFDSVSDDLPEKLFSIYPIIRSFEDLERYFLTDDRKFSLGIGGSQKRYLLSQKIKSLGGQIISVISKNAQIAPYGSHIGEGSCILMSAIIECDVRIGEGCLINNGVMLGHDTTVGNYCEISSGAIVTGGVKIGDFTEVGATAVVLPRVSIGDNCKVGAGAVVTKNVPDNTTVMGVPARPKVESL